MQNKFTFRLKNSGFDKRSDRKWPCVGNGQVMKYQFPENQKYLKVINGA